MLKLYSTLSHMYIIWAESRSVSKLPVLQYEARSKAPRTNCCQPEHFSSLSVFASIFRKVTMLKKETEMIYRECIIPPREVAEKPRGEVPGRVDC